MGLGVESVNQESLDSIKKNKDVKVNFSVSGLDAVGRGAEALSRLFNFRFSTRGVPRPATERLSRGASARMIASERRESRPEPVHGTKEIRELWKIMEGHLGTLVELEKAKEPLELTTAGL